MCLGEIVHLWMLWRWQNYKCCFIDHEQFLHLWRGKFVSPSCCGVWTWHTDWKSKGNHSNGLMSGGLHVVRIWHVTLHCCWSICCTMSWLKSAQSPFSISLFLAWEFEYQLESVEVWREFKHETPKVFCVCSVLRMLPIYKIQGEPCGTAIKNKHTHIHKTTKKVLGYNG